MWHFRHQRRFCRITGKIILLYITVERTSGTFGLKIEQSHFHRLFFQLSIFDILLLSTTTTGVVLPH